MYNITERRGTIGAQKVQERLKHFSSRLTLVSKSLLYIRSREQRMVTSLVLQELQIMSPGKQLSRRWLLQAWIIILIHL